MKDVSDITAAKRPQLEAALRTIQQARDLARAVQVQCPKLVGFTQKWMGEADGLRRSFEYFLEYTESEKAIHPAYRFSHWITLPTSLLDEIHRGMRLFDVELQPVEAMRMGTSDEVNGVSRA